MAVQNDITECEVPKSELVEKKTPEFLESSSYANNKLVEHPKEITNQDEELVFDVGDTMIMFRNEKSMSVADLAEKMMVSPSYVSSIENNKRKMNIDIICKISKALDIPPQVFFTEAILNQKTKNPNADDIRAVLKPVVARMVKRILLTDENVFESVLPIAMKDILPN